jgi:hypothetical protein
MRMAGDDTIFFIEVKVAGSGIRLDLFALRCALDWTSKVCLKDVGIHLRRTGRP